MKISYLICHHSAIKNSDNAHQFNAVKRYHIGKGWGDIGYHFFIESDGKLCIGRNVGTVGAHCRDSGMNYKSIGICVQGNFEVERPTTKQLDRFKRLILSLRKKYGVPNSRIIGHRDVSGASTVCPGKNFVSLIRKDFWDDKPKPKPIPTCPAPDCKKEKAEIASLMSEIRELTQTITSLKKTHTDALGASNKQVKRLEDDLKSLRITHKEEIKQKDDFANNIEREKIALKNDFDGKEEVLGKELVRVNLKADDLIEELKEARKKEKAIYSLKVKKYLLKIYKKK